MKRIIPGTPRVEDGRGGEGLRALLIEPHDGRVEDVAEEEPLAEGTM